MCESWDIDGGEWNPENWAKSISMDFHESNNYKP